MEQPEEPTFSTSGAVGEQTTEQDVVESSLTTQTETLFPHHLLESEYLTAPVIFSQEENHEEDVISYEGDSEMDARKADVTKTFFLTFFEFPRNSTIWDCQVPVDLIDYLYENVTPKRLRQRKQERSKYRLAELREALLASKEWTDKEVEVVGEEVVKKEERSTSSRSPGKRKAIELNKNDWIKKHNRKIYWVGMRGPIFPANQAMFEKLQRLLGRELPHLTHGTFQSLWERQSKKPAATNGKRQKTQVGGPQAPSQFPLYDVWKDSDQDGHSHAHAHAHTHAHHPTNDPTTGTSIRPSYVHFAFDLPGMSEEPKFSFSKASRRWQLEGSRPFIPDRKFAVQQRWHGKFCVYGTLPASVDVSKAPQMHYENGVLHVTLEEYLE